MGLVQEAFIRLSRNRHNLENPARATAYLRVIVLNLARDHNRRGLVSLRHRPAAEPYDRSAEDRLVVREDQQELIDTLAELAHRQRDCLVLRYFLELPVGEIAETLDLSINTVKTHLRRGLEALRNRLGEGP